MRTKLGMPMRRLISGVFGILLFFSAGAAFSYDGALFNSLFNSGKVEEAMAMVDKTSDKPIDVWRLARGHAALGDCSQALLLLDEAAKAAKYKINFLSRPDDFHEWFVWRPGEWSR